MTTARATATIIALNEADNIEDCIRSVSFFDEVLVIDSGSTDNTVALAQAAGANVLVNPWPGYGQQKQFAIEHARNDWVFSIDADERASPELRASILALLAGTPGAKGYTINRCNHFMGQALRHGEGYPDRCLRLFDRKCGNWTHDPVHERVTIKGKVERLAGDLNHFSVGSIEEYLRKQNQYTSLQARKLFAAGRRSSLVKMTTSPIVRFFKFYFLRLGFLDGLPGLIHISIGCFNSFCKYAKLRELENTRHACSRTPPDSP